MDHYVSPAVIITGGSSGLGKALALRFIKDSATIALIARDRNKLARIKEELSALCASGQRVEIFPCDVSDYPEVATGPLKKNQGA